MPPVQAKTVPCAEKMLDKGENFIKLKREQKIPEGSGRGFHEAVLHRNKPDAKAGQKWVTDNGKASEIGKRGFYI